MAKRPIAIADSQPCNVQQRLALKCAASAVVVQCVQKLNPLGRWFKCLKEFGQFFRLQSLSVLQRDKKSPGYIGIDSEPLQERSFCLRAECLWLNKIRHLKLAWGKEIQFALAQGCGEGSGSEAPGGEARSVSEGDGEAVGGGVAPHEGEQNNEEPGSCSSGNSGVTPLLRRNPRPVR